MSKEQHPKLETLAEELGEIIDALTAIRARHYNVMHKPTSVLVQVAPLVSEMLDLCPGIASQMDKEKSNAFDAFASLYDDIRKLKEAVCVEEDEV